MSKNVEVLPFTELVERTQEISRVASVNDLPKTRGYVNDVYARKIPAEEDWTFFMASSAITCDAEYKTGTVTINTQATAATFSTDAVLTAGMTGRKIKFSDNPDVYNLTFSNATGGTVSPVLSGDRNVSSGAYSIFNPYYALAGNFDRFPKNGGLLLYQGGRPTVIPESSVQRYFSDYTPFPGTPQKCRLINFGTAGTQYVEVTPPPQKAINLPYEYLIRPTILSQTTAGVANIAAGGTAVTGSAGVSKFTEAQTGWYFRIDAFGVSGDSEWYRVIAIANDSALTLQTVFGLSGAVSAGYTLSPIPAMPAKMHPAVLHGAVMSVLADQNDALFKFHQDKYREVINDGKRTYKSRIYAQEVETVLEDFKFRR